MRKTQSTNYLINGEFTAGISPLDRGFAYGDGVFRTLKVVDGLPVMWPLHYQKLVQDCSAIGLVCPEADAFIHDIQQLFTDNLATGVAKLIVTRGVGGRGYGIPPIVTPNRVVIQSPMPDYQADFFEAGVSLHICETKLAHQPALAKIKHLNRLENVLARAEVSSAYFDGLVLDMQENVIECTSANIFIRQGNTLYTPDLSQCGVAGVARQSIINMATHLDLTVQETNISFTQLLSADEVVISNSVYGAFQVAQVGEKKWAQQPLAAQIRLQLSAA